MKEIIYGNYIIKSTGSIYSIKCKRDLSVQKVKCRRIYRPVVSLYFNGKQRTIALNTLIAKIFIPNPNNYKYVKQLDGNVMNCNVENIVWVEHPCKGRRKIKERDVPYYLSQFDYNQLSDTQKIIYDCLNGDPSGMLLFFKKEVRYFTKVLMSCGYSKCFQYVDEIYEEFKWDSIRKAQFGFYSIEKFKDRPLFIVSLRNQAKWYFLGVIKKRFGKKYSRVA